MIHIFLVLCSLASAQEISSSTVISNIELLNLSKDVRELQSGRPTITGVPYWLSGTSVGAAGITFSDGSVQTTAANISVTTLTASGYVRVASDVYKADLSTHAFTATAGFTGACNVANSTITINCYGAPIEVYYEGGIDNSGAAIAVFMGALCNGKFCGNHGHTKGGDGATADIMFVGHIPDNNQVWDASWSRTIRGLSGAQNICLGFDGTNNVIALSLRNKFGARCVLTP